MPPITLDTPTPDPTRTPHASHPTALVSQLLHNTPLPLPPHGASAVECAHQLLLEHCIRPDEDGGWQQEALPAVADAGRLLGAPAVEVGMPLEHALAAYSRVYLVHVQAEQGLETLVVCVGWWGGVVFTSRYMHVKCMHILAYIHTLS